MANTLNKYFSSVFNQEQLKHIPRLPRYVLNTLDTLNFRLQDVQEKLNHLHMYKSFYMHPRVLRTLEDMLCGPLNHIFNKLAETGKIPEDWKSANVTAIHKL